MIKAPKKKVRKRISKKITKRKVNKKSFRRNPEDYDNYEEPVEYTKEQLKELQTLLLKKLENLRLRSSGENLSPERLSVIQFLKTQVKSDPEGSMYIINAMMDIGEDLGKIITKWGNGEKVVIPEFKVEFD